MMTDRDTIRSWLKWSSLTGVLYCFLCFLAVIMALQGGLFPEPGTPPPSPMTKAIAASGRTILTVLTRPVAGIKRCLPGKTVPGIDYLYFFFTGFVVASGVFWTCELMKSKRGKPPKVRTVPK